MGEPKTSDHVQIKIQKQNPSQETPASSKASNQDFRGTDHLCTFKNQDKEPKFGTWVYQRPVTILKSRSRCQTQVRNFQCPPNPKIRTLRKYILESYNSNKTRRSQKLTPRQPKVNKIRGIKVKTSTQKLQRQYVSSAKE